MAQTQFWLLGARNSHLYPVADVRVASGGRGWVGPASKSAIGYSIVVGGGSVLFPKLYPPRAHAVPNECQPSMRNIQ